MSELCSRIVEKLDTTWPVIGWALFIGWFLGPYFSAGSAASFYSVMLGFGLSLLIWWLIDVIDQQVAGWQILLGIVMLGIGVLPRGGLLSIAAWIIYWTRVRE
jgi:hypothetical protein